MKKCNQCINAAGRQDLVEGKIICRCETSVYSQMPVEDIPEVECKDFEEADINKWVGKWGRLAYNKNM